ncbi:hypothetical protein C0989_012618 [Termitomyces sp. Mn162]|nr:hypothetical protein C0989_012618 [Termitomyces sp. Mn162]
MGFFRRLLNLVRPRARRTSDTDHDHWDRHRERRGHHYRHTYGNRDSELSRYPSQDRTSITSHGRPSTTFDERYHTAYNEQPPTSTRRHHDAQFFTALPSAPFSPLSLPATSENLPTIGCLDPPGALGILMHGEQQHNQAERPNLYRTIPLPPVTPTPGNSSASRLSLPGAGNFPHSPFGRLDAPGALGISMHQGHRHFSGTIPLPPVNSTPVNSPVSNNQADSASMVPPQANHLGPEESSPVAGNSTSLPLGSPAQGITYEIPQVLHLANNLKIENPISMQRLLSILLFCSDLEMLSVMINEDDVTHAVDFSSRVAAENLISLSIVTSVESKLILDKFTAPNLWTFHLEWNSQESRNLIPISADIGIDLFVKKSECYLNTLSLVNLFPDEVQLVQCLKLKMSQNLQTLVVRNSGFTGFRSSGRVITEMTLKTLSQFNGNAPLCPSLSKLEITPCCAPDGQLISMVKVRNVSAQDHRTFNLHYSLVLAEVNPFIPSIDWDSQSSFADITLRSRRGASSASHSTSFCNQIPFFSCAIFIHLYKTILL